MENLKYQGKRESNIQIHPSFTYQIDHGKERDRASPLKPEQKGKVRKKLPPS